MKDVVDFISKCLPCTVSEDVRPGRQVPLEIVHPRGRFEQVAVDVQTVTPRTVSGNIKILAMIDVFTRFVRAIPIPDEKAETIARVIVDEWVSIFGPMVRLLSDRGPNLIGKIVEEMSGMLGIGRLRTYPLHPQANGTVERWNRTVGRDLASFVCTGAVDWDDHVALACFRYNSSVCEATGMTPFKAMFGTDAFEAWGELDAERHAGEPGCLAKGLSRLHKVLVGNARKARGRAASHYDKALQETKYNPGDRVLLWPPEINSQEGKKVIKPWIGPYVVVAPLGRVCYELRSEVGDRRARVHANRLRKINDAVVESGEPRDGVFPDSLRMLGKIRGAKESPCPETGELIRWFRVQVGGRRSRRWTKEIDLPEVVVKLYDRQHAHCAGRAEVAESDDQGAIETGDVGPTHPSSMLAFDEVFGSSTEEDDASGGDL